MASTIAVDEGSKPVKTILSVKVFVDPENQEEFLKHFKTAFEHVVAETECRYFVAGKDAFDPTCLCWTEGWTEDAQWLQEVQLKKEYYVPYIQATEKLFIKDRIIELSIPHKSLAVFKTPESS